MNRPRYRFPQHGTIGLLGLLLMEVAVFCGATGAAPGVPWQTITQWTTPVCWWAYLLVVDAWLYRRKGLSWLLDRRADFLLLCLVSVAWWCVFEAYNRLLPGWQYVNLHPHLVVRYAGYGLSFATILPGLFLTAQLLQSYRFGTRVRLAPVQWTRARANASWAVGLACCVVPVLVPAASRGHLWAFVWVGWVLLLEPLNYRRIAPSLYRDWERGDGSRTVQLLAAGVICGLLWEFWNYWAGTKWVYIFPVPVAPNLRYFEIPLVGFLGFLPFALSSFAAFHFLASFYTTEDKLGL